jgi:glycosyltransferase involved in cell wall biosynthesis
MSLINCFKRVTNSKAAGRMMTFEGMHFTDEEKKKEGSDAQGSSGGSPRQRLLMLKAWKYKKSKYQGTIAANIIAKNEEKNIGRCIRSVKEVVDQVIVIDTGSNDGTMKEALKEGAQIEQLKWNDDFSAPRNYALDLSKTDWILSIDADEVLPELGKREIRELARLPEIAGWHMDTMNYIKGARQLNVLLNDGMYKEGKEFPYYVESTKTRMFQKIGGVRWRFPVHELIDTSIIEAGGKFGKAVLKIQHLHRKEKDGVLKTKATFYLKLCEKKVRDNPFMGHAWAELAVCELQLGKFTRAARSYYAALSRGEDNARNRYGYAGVLRILGETEKSDLEIERAICKDFPNLTQVNKEGD